VSARNPFPEPHIFDFEILYALAVNAEATFAGENERYCRIAASLRLRRMNFSLARAGFGYRLANLKLSDSPRSYAQPVNCRRIPRRSRHQQRFLHGYGKNMIQPPDDVARQIAAAERTGHCCCAMEIFARAPLHSPAPS
jgi:hypothetical protein